jgi:pimeloyl-ACP methyl ester carboxylesterase
MEPRRRSFHNLSPHGFHEVVYWEWGDPACDQVVVCVHGLTRNGRDFDELAAALAPRFRVLCPDMPGRGESEWLGDPHDYVFPVYLALLAALIARSNAERVGWMGTSMGGLLGMVLAAQAKTPISRLVINDVGPVFDPAALKRIAAYLGMDPRFNTFEELEAHIRAVSASFGPLTDAQWRRLAETTSRRLPDGGYALRYDPGIAIPFAESNNVDTNLWPLWDAITCPTLVLRGMQSDLLSPETAAAMQSRGPRARLVEFPGIGHAPALKERDQIMAVTEFLDAA